MPWEQRAKSSTPDSVSTQHHCTILESFYAPCYDTSRYPTSAISKPAHLAFNQHQVKVRSFEEGDWHLVGLFLGGGLELAHFDFEGLDWPQRTIWRFPMEIAERKMGGEVFFNERPHVVWVIVCINISIGSGRKVQVMELRFFAIVLVDVISVIQCFIVTNQIRAPCLSRPASLDFVSSFCSACLVSLAAGRRLFASRRCPKR